MMPKAAKSAEHLVKETADTFGLKTRYINNSNHSRGSFKNSIFLWISFFLTFAQPQALPTLQQWIDYVFITSQTINRDLERETAGTRIQTHVSPTARHKPVFKPGPFKLGSNQFYCGLGCELK